LRIIVRTPSCRVQNIAQALRITVGAASKLVDRLEAARLCARRAHPDDRRSTVLEATEAGRRTHIAAEDALLDELTHRLNGQATTDLHTLSTLLAGVRTTIAAAAT
jgi:DNA-binding MarR family transcriptional regulator